MIITRKIELWLSDEDKNKRNEQWAYLRALNDDVFKAANLIVNHQYYNEIHKERLVMSELQVIDKAVKALKEEQKATKDKAQKEKFKEEITEHTKKRYALVNAAKKQLEAEAGTSQQNTTYQIVGEHFPNMPSHVQAELNNSISSLFAKEYKEVVYGKRSLRNYRKGMPIPFMKSAMRFVVHEKDIFMHWVSGITFKLNFGRFDKSNNRIIIERIMDGTYKFGNSQIQIKDDKLFLLLVVDVPTNKQESNPNLSVGVDLGINIPAYCALSEGLMRLPLGNREDFLKERTQMQARYQRLQKALKITNGGHGRTKKLKALEALQEKEKNFAKTYNHNISHQIVKFAVDNKASLIKLELLEGIAREEKNRFLLRNWSYYQLQTLIQYKAEKYGIQVAFIDPYHTSQSCAVCGHYEPNQRIEQAVFVCKNEACKNAGVQVNADYNGALNIAKSQRFVTSKEECQYYLLSQKKKETPSVTTPNEGKTITE